MKAAPGDRIIIRGHTVESSDRHGQILEVRGPDGAPPYQVRFDDGHETILFPGNDFVVERQAQTEGIGRPAEGPG